MERSIRLINILSNIFIKTQALCKDKKDGELGGFTRLLGTESGLNPLYRFHERVHFAFIPFIEFSQPLL
jgi:hypothetical protein